MSPLVVVTLIIIFVVFAILVKIINKSGRIFSYNRVKWLFVSYLFVLVTSIVVYTFIPYENANGKERDENNVNLVETALAGKTDQITDSYKKKEWLFEYKGNWIELELPDDQYSELTIVIERKDKNDGKVEATLYHPKSFANDIDITDQLGLMDLHLKKDTLTLTKPHEIHLEFTQFTKEFPITQFTGENWIDDGPIAINQGLLYLRIPKNLNIVESTDVSNIHYVGE
ncbi:hypothetical protein [Bacillus sp. FJAT-52991]|uniref:DUF4352 domain-containing protein n=1 Tax=Bacillus kandeliae TaxID=3129297 RepID=A0ABZ2N9U6_9BACI